MLGELLYEETGKVTGTRVLSAEGGEAKLEVDLQTEGNILGVKETTLWTYWSTTRADGSMHGEGKGVMTTANGEVIFLKGTGVAQAKPPGEDVAFRGMIYFHTSSPTFSRLNTVGGVHEYDVDSNGNATVKVWEWK